MSLNDFYLEIIGFFLSTAAIGQNMKSGRELFDFLEKRGQIGPSDLSCLSENFEWIHRKDLSIKVKQFSEKELGKKRFIINYAY
jgi:hypothetical protein